jgi:molybdenum cofactor cytidylyltransferase
LRSDRGARAIIAAHRDTLVLIETRDSGVLFDVDTPMTLADRQAFDDPDSRP